MSETNQEPTMEEILASIRRIISEDDAPAEGEAPAEAGPAAAAHAPAEHLHDLDIPAAEPPPMVLEGEGGERPARLDGPQGPHEPHPPHELHEPLGMSDLEIM